MDRSEFAAWEERIRARADQLWRDAGRPEGGSRSFMAQARELIAMQEVAVPTLDPEEAARPVIEEASVQGNLGEFPTLTDQGEEMTYPHAGSDDDGPRLSDEDSSDHGGILPVDETPDADLPDATLAEGDVTTSSVNAEDGPLNPDLNEDGLPDRRDLDANDVERELPPNGPRQRQDS